jgi:glycosyltransferase involved in cell wall biosynthesis
MNTSPEGGGEVEAHSPAGKTETAAPGGTSSTLPVVSIIIAVYNQQQYLAQTLQSCLDQSFQAWELILVDDGSTDGTASVIDTFLQKDARLKSFTSINQGQCAARNIGLSLASGKYLKFLDGDDLLTRDVLTLQVEAAQKYASGMVGGTLHGFWDNEENSLDLALKGEPEVTVFADPVDFNETTKPTFNETLFETALVRKAGGLPGSLRAAEEFNLLLRMFMVAPELKPVQARAAIIYKRFSPSGQAQIRGHQKGVHWMTVSLLDLAGRVERPSSLPPKLRAYLAGFLHLCAIYGFRDGRMGDCWNCYEQWRRFGLGMPPLRPAYHAWLHRSAGFFRAERILLAARKIKKIVLRK